MKRKNDVMYTDAAGWCLILCTSAIVIAAAVIDYRTCRIPNKLTVPAFFLGWVYQFWAHGPAGLLDGLQGFALGFGLYFILWLIASGGGGDTKLVGAISVWLGFRNTLGMVVVSTLFVILGTLFVLIWNMATRGVYRTARSVRGGTPVSDKSRKQLQMLRINRNRTGMTFATSVALATICVTLFAVPDWPYRKAAQAARAERLNQQQALQPDTARASTGKSSAAESTSEESSSADSSSAVSSSAESSSVPVEVPDNSDRNS